MTMLMEPKDAAQLVCLRVVDGYELESLTKRGWKVVETILTSEPVEIMITMTDAEMQQRGQMHGGCGQFYFDGVGQVPSGMKRSKALGQVCKFLVGQPEKDALDELATQLDSEKNKRHQAEREFGEVAKVASKSEDDLAKLKLEMERCSEGKERLQNRVFELDDLRRKLELDIGKLRTALGDLRMKEILEGAGK